MVILKAPYKTTYNNLLLTQNREIWAYYKLDPQIMPLTDKLKKDDYKHKFKKFLTLLSEYQDFHLQMYPKDMLLDERFEQLSKDFDKQNRDIAMYYANKTVELLKKQLGNRVTKNIFILGICLTKRNLSTQT